MHSIFSIQNGSKHQVCLWLYGANVVVIRVDKLVSLDVHLAKRERPLRSCGDISVACVLNDKA